MSIVDGYTLNQHVDAERKAKTAENLLRELRQIARFIQNNTHVLPNAFDVNDLDSMTLEDVEVFFVMANDSIKEELERWKDAA